MTDLEKFKKLFGEIGIKYDEEKGRTKLPTTILYINTEYLSGNTLKEDEGVSITFDSEGSFSHFEGSGI